MLWFRVYWIKIIVFVYLFVFFKCRVEFAHWSLKRLLQNNIGDLCSIWEAMNNMITLQHTEIKHLLRQVHMWLDMFLKLPYTKNYLAWYQGMR